MIKILLVERNLIFSSNLEMLLNHDKEINVVGICREGNEVLEFIKKNDVDIVLMDNLQINGFVITDLITGKYPNIKVIGFSTYDEGRIDNRLVELGAYSCLSKYNTTLDELISEIKNCKKTIKLTE